VPLSTDPLYRVRDLKLTYQRGRGPLVRAVDGVDLDWRRGETLGLVGESGCGKSTLARSLVGLETPSDGTIEFDGQPVDRDLRALRRRVQLIFQDPYQSMNPRRTVGAQVQEGLAATGMRSGDQRLQRAVAALHDAGLAPADRFWRRYPHELSGGQRQRVVIAAALALEPEALVCDEPVSALDVSVRTQVLRLLVDLRVSRQLSLLLITHDVGLAWSMCDRVAVMYLGRIVEIGTTEQVLGDPQHPYTKALLAVAPRIEPRTGDRILLQGEPPDATAIPTGCRFHPRCPVAFDRCPVDDPYLPESERGAACWLVPGAREARTALRVV
jgi:oligopeptide/dipeptide ABC transporter ATP-binding protein